MLILDLCGISFHAVVVFGLGKKLSFKSVLGCRGMSRNEQGTNSFGQNLLFRVKDRSFAEKDKWYQFVKEKILFDAMFVVLVSHSNYFCMKPSEITNIEIKSSIG